VSDELLTEIRDLLALNNTKLDALLVAYQRQTASERQANAFLAQIMTPHDAAPVDDPGARLLSTGAPDTQPTEADPSQVRNDWFIGKDGGYYYHEADGSTRAANLFEQRIIRARDKTGKRR
jgi:hypothetical protein